MPVPALLRGRAVVAYALGASAAFDGLALLLALGLGTATSALTTEWRSPAEPLAAVTAAGASGQLVLVDGATRRASAWQVVDPRRPTSSLGRTGTKRGLA